jgi:hypothetical protein
VLERPRGGGDVGEGRVTALHAEAGEPSQGRAFEAVRLSLTDCDADRQGVAEVDLRELGGGGAEVTQIETW